MEIFEPRATAEAVGEDKRELRGRPRSLARFRASERRITFFVQVGFEFLEPSSF
jgi:hypothetical protein